MNDTELQRERDREKEDAVIAIKQAIADLKVAAHPLGKWHRHHLAHAIDNVSRGLFGLAHTCANLAALSDGYSDKLIVAEPLIEKLTLNDFERAILSVERTPAPLHPSFGPWRR